MLSSFAPWCAETCISASDRESKKPHQGFAGQNLILHRGIEWSKSTLALGLPEWAGKTVLGPAAAANNGTPQQTARQKCLSQAYSAPEGKAVQFLSPVSLTPLNPNWQANWGEWGVALFGKGGGMFGSGIGTDTGIQTLNGVQNVGSWLENTTGSVLKVGEEVAPFAMAGAALLDLAIQAQCALDPSAPPEGIPIAPK